MEQMNKGKYWVGLTWFKNKQTFTYQTDLEILIQSISIIFPLYEYAIWEPGSPNPFDILWWIVLHQHVQGDSKNGAKVSFKWGLKSPRVKSQPSAWTFSTLLFWFSYEVWSVTWISLTGYNNNKRVIFSPLIELGILELGWNILDCFTWDKGRAADLGPSNKFSVIPSVSLENK